MEETHLSRAMKLKRHRNQPRGSEGVDGNSTKEPLQVPDLLRWANHMIWIEPWNLIEMV